MRKSTRRLLRAASIAAVAAALVPDASAVPAKPGLVERRQADGTSLLVRLHGDEFSHFILSEDGYPLVEEGGLLYFAQTAPDGAMKPSPFRAASPAARDQATLGFLASFDRDEAAARAAAGAAKAAKAMRSRRSAMQKGPGLITTTFPGKGDQKALVVLVSYSDHNFNVRDAHSYFSGLLNEPGFSEWNATGSARDYFLESSDGLFRPEFDVYGPVKLPNSMAYYGGNDFRGEDLHPELMAVHACQALDSSVDFSQYDRDGDGVIDNVFVFYAGEGEASGGSSSTVWPHSWDVRYATDTPYVFDGVTLGHYACTNEWAHGRPDGIGTFVHEFSHVLGLPDLYTTVQNAQAFTPGSWSVLDYGPYNNDGRTPPLYSSYERYALDWIDPVVLTGPANVSLPPLGANRAYMARTDDDNEFFLFENRQQAGWDKYLPGHGMLVWHVDFDQQVWDSKNVNNDHNHQYVDLEEADNIRTDASRAGDAFPGTARITSFTEDTAPSMRGWDGKGLGLPITEIAEANGIVSFKVSGGMEASEAPQAQDPADGQIFHDGFTARWKAVADADHYELNVYRASSPSKAVAVMKAPSAAWADAGTATEYRVEGLDPSTDYAYVVFAVQKGKGLSPASNEIRVSTIHAPLSGQRPKALDATDITESGFTANWQALDGAQGYLLNVSRLTPEKYAQDVADLDGGQLPLGWESSSTSTYTDAAFCGKDAPSLRLTLNGAYVSSPEYATAITGFSFWQRGRAEAAGNKLRVDWFVGGEWEEGPLFDVATAEGGATETLTSVPAGARAVRIMYVHDDRRYSVGIDDMTVTTVSEYSQTPLPLFTDRLVENGLSMRVDELTPGAVYGYTVMAKEGEERSLPSEMVIVSLPGRGGVGSVEAADGGEAEYYDLQGMRLTAPAKGSIVIRRQGGRSSLIKL